MDLFGQSGAKILMFCPGRRICSLRHIWPLMHAAVMVYTLHIGPLWNTLGWHLGFPTFGLTTSRDRIFATITGFALNSRALCAPKSIFVRNSPWNLASKRCSIQFNSDICTRQLMNITLARMAKKKAIDNNNVHEWKTEKQINQLWKSEISVLFWRSGARVRDHASPLGTSSTRQTRRSRTLVDPVSLFGSWDVQ